LQVQGNGNIFFIAGYQPGTKHAALIDKQMGN